MLKWKSIITLLLLSGFAGVSAHAELGLQQALEIAVSTSPDVAVLNANADGARAARVAAGRLPDPKLAIGVENLPVTGEDRWQFNRDFMTMKRIGVMQEFPNHDKRSAQQEMANAAVEQADAERRVGLLAIRRAVASVWLERYYLERQSMLLDDLEKENVILSEAVRVQVASGKGKAAEMIAPRQESVELANRRDEILTAIIKSKASLRRWIGDAADEKLPSEAPDFNIDVIALREQVSAHPELSVYAPMLQSARAALREAEAGSKPDWGVELFYARRAADFGDMVSLQFTIGLPIAKRTRQEPGIAASRQLIQQVTAQRQQVLSEHVQDTESDIAEYQSLSRQCKRTSDTRIPLAQQKTDLEYAAYRSGTSSLNELLGARRELLEEKFKLIELQRLRALVMAKLHFTAGVD